MQSCPRLQTPAWISISTNEVTPRYMAGDLLAACDLTLDGPQEALQIDDRDDYYSANLKQLVRLARQDRR